MADMQMPALPGTGPEPIPHYQEALTAGNPSYSVPDLGASTPGPGVLADAAGGILQESGYAHDMNAGAVAPYYACDISPVYTGGDADAGGRDDVSATVTGSVANAEARFGEHQSDTLAQGSTIGDIVTLPPSPFDPAAGLLPAGAYYDPPRNY